MDILNEIYKNKKFEVYYNELISYNQHTNLTAITEKGEVYIKHFLDSVLPIDLIKNNAKLLDVGSGAGFPSIPIKILRPDVEISLIDSLNKRVIFLNDLVKKLNINAKIYHARAEDFCLNYREQFDVVVARAVAPMNTLCEYLLPFVKLGGIVLAYKGSNYLTELENSTRAIEILGGTIEGIKKYSLPNLENNFNSMGERNIIVIKKIKHTPKEYPRKLNKPKTEPIK